MHKQLQATALDKVRGAVKKTGICTLEGSLSLWTTNEHISALISEKNSLNKCLNIFKEL